MLQTNQDSAPAQEVVLEVRKRVLKACLAPAILGLLSERNSISATNIIEVFKKCYDIALSSGTVYPVLDALEKKGDIKRLPHRIKRLYVLTNKGKATIENLQKNVGNLNNLVTELIKKRNNQK